MSAIEAAGRRSGVTAALITAVIVVLAGTARAELALDALRATVRITDGASGGTGFIVMADRTHGEPQPLLVTAAHVLKEMRSPTCTLVFRARSDEGGYVRKEVQLPLRDGERQLWVQHPEMDVAVAAVKLPPDIDVQPFDHEQVATPAHAEEGRVHVGQEVCIPCFPVQLSANEAGWPILRKGTIATHPLWPLSRARTMFVDYSHFGGDSGAPVVAWCDQKAVVVGLVTDMQRQEDHSEIPFEKRTVYTPMGLAIAVQAPLVRETIDLWLKQADEAGVIRAGSTE
jgi:hypothetical protein